MKKPISQRQKHVTEEFLDNRVEIIRSQVGETIRVSEERILNAFREYRDEVLTKMDGIVGELEQIREDQTFMRHDIKNLDERVTKLESSHSH